VILFLSNECDDLAWHQRGSIVGVHGNTWISDMTMERNENKMMIGNEQGRER
jgi:hypothetical protein